MCMCVYMCVRVCVWPRASKVGAGVRARHSKRITQGHATCNGGGGRGTRERGECKGYSHGVHAHTRTHTRGVPHAIHGVAGVEGDKAEQVQTGAPRPKVPHPVAERRLDAVRCVQVCGNTHKCRENHLRAQGVDSRAGAEHTEHDATPYFINKRHCCKRGQRLTRWTAVTIMAPPHTRALCTRVRLLDAGQEDANKRGGSHAPR